ncbi:MAG TPA: SagB/ThcOx family dehydrogenase [Frankiaceae bacterium]|nr:SagB/ThcOx family dehydrogenase [Frankiaceae bacterium]
MTAVDASEPAIATDGDARLAALLAGCTPEEREVLADMVETSRRHGSDFDLVQLVHHNMKADLYSALSTDYEELLAIAAPPMFKTYTDVPKVALPEAADLDHSLDAVIRARASRRDFGSGALTLAEIATLLHYTCGVKKHILAYNRRDFPVRFQPNAGGLQSFETYLVVNRVEGLARGVYHFAPDENVLDLVDRGNFRVRLTSSCLHQEWVSHAGAVLVFTTVPGRLMWKYGPRSYRYAHVDVGIATGAAYLIATALKLRACAVSGFMDSQVDDIVGIDGRTEFTQLLFAVGTRPGRRTPGANDDVAPSADPTG